MLTESERFLVRAGGPDDVASILEACRRCTGAAPSLAEWSWAFERNPAGSRTNVVLDAGGTLVAHFATRSHRVVVDGEECRFGQVAHPFADSNVDPDPHAPHLLVEAARDLLSGGAGGGDLVSYVQSGPGTWARWEVVKRHLRFELLRMQSRLVRAAGPAREELPRRFGGLEVDLRLREGPRDEVRELYDRAREPLFASQVRDTAFLRWRFLERPGVDYDMLFVRDAGGALLGYAAARIENDGGASSYGIVDWLVPEGDRPAGRALLDGLLSRASSHGAATIHATLPEWSPWFAFFQEEGFLVTPTDLLTAIRRRHPRHEVYFLRDNWWYQPADFDEV